MLQRFSCIFLFKSPCLLQCDCSMIFDVVDVLTSDPDRFKVLMKEIVLIKRIMHRTIKLFFARY